MPALSQLKYELPPQLARFAGSQVGKDAKMMAARGMLPLPPRDLVYVLFSLARDDDQAISKMARDSLFKMPANLLKTIIEDKNTHPLVLDFMARGLESSSVLQDTIALNPSTHDDTIVFQATLRRKELVDIISQNQARILRRPDIVDSLAENIMMGQAQLERIIKFVEMETSRRKRTEQKNEPPPDDQMEVEIEEIENEEEEVPLVTEPGENEVGAVTEDESPWAAMTFDEELVKDYETESEEEEEILETNLTRKIANMKVSQKIKLALSGGKQARSILIKDANKMVSSSVLKSPRITESEIETISRSRSISDEVVRLISSNRDWTKSYQVKLNLVQNPKTPLPESMRFMNHLREKDLRDIARSRNVPSQISTQAKRMLQRKDQKSKPGTKH